jgi:hypothetical protein
MLDPCCRDLVSSMGWYRCTITSCDSGTHANIILRMRRRSFPCFMWFDKTLSKKTNRCIVEIGRVVIYPTSLQNCNEFIDVKKKCYSQYNSNEFNSNEFLSKFK